MQTAVIIIGQKDNDGQPVGQLVAALIRAAVATLWPVSALTFAHLSIALITLFALAPVAAWCVLANCILAAQMLIRRALVDVC